jgi:hypothetical protein
MIPHTLTHKQEHKIRIEYVNSPGFDMNSYSAYHTFAVSNIPGAIDAVYRGGDDFDTLEALVFDEEKNLCWFLLRYS